MERILTLKPQYYSTSLFARKASVSSRTLRYYDSVGLLSPRRRSAAGYRYYADEDLLRLQQILALKFLGLSLEEIRVCLRVGPKRLEHVLGKQRAMMVERRNQLDVAIQAIAETEELLQQGHCDWNAIARVIKVIQMQQDRESLKRQYVEEKIKDPLIRDAYSESALWKLAETGATWSEEDQKQAESSWRQVASEARRLAETGADPAGQEAQAMAKLKFDLLQAFTRGDPEITEGLKAYRSKVADLPPEQQPWDNTPFDPGPAGNELLDKAMAIYQQRLNDIAAD